MSLQELFCAVDDFWMSFVPMWHHTQVENGRQRPRAGYMYRSRDYDDPHPFSPVPFSDFQSLLYRVCPGSSQKRVSAFSELSALCGTHPADACPEASLAVQKVRSMHRHQFHRLHLFSSLSSQTHQSTPGLCRAGHSRQDLGGLVLWLQTPSGGQ